MIISNTSHYILITEYGLDDLDQVRSTLIKSDAVDGTYNVFDCSYRHVCTPTRIVYDYYFYAASK